MRLQHFKRTIRICSSLRPLLHHFLNIGRQILWRLQIIQSQSRVVLVIIPDIRSRYGQWHLRQYSTVAGRHQRNNSIVLILNQGTLLYPCARCVIIVHDGSSIKAYRLWRAKNIMLCSTRWLHNCNCGRYLSIIASIHINRQRCICIVRLRVN